MAKGDLIDSEANRQASLVVRRLREYLGSKKRNQIKPLRQDLLAELLSARLGTPVTQGMVSAWESGNSQVPAAVLIEAPRIYADGLGRPTTIEELLERISQFCVPEAALAA